MAAFNLHNYGGSDEATEMIIAGAYKALFHQIEFRCGAENIARGCPGQRTIAMIRAKPCHRHTPQSHSGDEG